MKKNLFYMFVLLMISAGTAAQFETNFKTAPVDLIAGFAEKTPPYSMGPFGEILYFPWAIETGFTEKSLLGFGGYLGYFFMLDDPHTNFISSSILFDGRLNFSEKFGIDMDAGFGLLNTKNNSAFHGTFGVAGLLKVKETTKLRLYVGLDFASNPDFDILSYYSKEFIVWLHANLGVVLKLRK